MKMSRWFVPTGLMLVAGGWLVIHEANRKPAKFQGREETTAVSPPVARDVPLVMRAAGPENAHPIATMGGAFAAAHDAPTRAAPEPTSGARTAAPPAVAAEDLRDYIHVAVQKQQPDARWTKEVKGVLEDAVRNFAGEGTAVRSVQCGAEACEAHIVHDSEDAYADFMRKAFKGRGFEWTGEAFVTRNSQAAESGKQEMVVFLARPEGQLPRLD